MVEGIHPINTKKQINKLMSVFSCVCSVIDHEFRHHIVKGAVDPRGDSRVADYFGNVMTKFVVDNRTDALKSHMNLFFYDDKLSNCQIVGSR